MKEFLLLALPVLVFILNVAIYGRLKGYEKEIEELEKDIEDKLKAMNEMSWAFEEKVFNLERGHNELVRSIDCIKNQQDGHNERIRKLEQ